MSESQANVLVIQLAIVTIQLAILISLTSRRR